MPGRGSYGPGGKWIYTRAKHLRAKNPDMDESTSFAVATQQAHKVNKSPKSFRTAQGVREAKAKMTGSIKEYMKTASIAGLLDELEKISAGVGYVGPIQKQTEENDFFRKVLFTGKHAQLVLMSVDDEIGEETHDAVDQFFRIDGGQGAVIMDGVRHAIKDGDAFVIPAGTRHNVINTSETEPLKLYSVYSPPNHPPGTIHKTKEEAVAAEKTAGLLQPDQPRAKDVITGRGPTQRAAREVLRDKLRAGCPKAKALLEKKANGDDDDEASTPGKRVPKQVLVDFFKKNPKADDDQVHELAEAHGTDPHTMETQIYGILGEALKKKASAQVRNAFFDEMNKISADIRRIAAESVGQARKLRAAKPGIMSRYGRKGGSARRTVEETQPGLFSRFFGGQPQTVGA